MRKTKYCFVGTLILAAMLAAIGNGLAATYYVKTDGNDANDGLSPAAAWATIDRGQPTYLTNAVSIGDTTIGVDNTDSFLPTGKIKIDSEVLPYSAKTPTTFTVTPATNAHPGAATGTWVYDNDFSGGNSFDSGDIIMVNEGTYCQQADLSRNSITYRASGAGVIDGENIRRYGFRLGFLNNPGYVTVDGFEIKKATTAGIYAEGQTGWGVGCQFVNNYCHDNPNGIYLVNSTHSVIGNRLSNNTYGLSLAYANSHTITSNIFANNTYGIYGGYYGGHNILRNIFYGNATAWYNPEGNGSWVVNFVNNSIYGTTGNAIFIASVVTYSPVVTLKNNIVSSSGGWGITTSGTNNTIAEDYNCYYNNTSGAVNTNYSITRGGHSIFDKNPLFVNPAGQDFHLRSKGGTWNGSGWTRYSEHSPCIDAGDPASSWTNEPQPNGGRVNMGAYGNTAEASKCLWRGTIFTIR